MLGEGASVLPPAVWAIVTGAIFIAGTLFEARRYRPPVQPGGTWETTGERFVDPTSGRLTEVRYNPQTGEREYVDVS